MTASPAGLAEVLWLVHCTPHRAAAAERARNRAISSRWQIGRRVVAIARMRILVCPNAMLGLPRTADLELASPALAREFPTVTVLVECAFDGPNAPLPTFDLPRWMDRRESFDPFDEHVAALVERGRATIVVRGHLEEVRRAAFEMLTRWQRWLDRRNAASATPEFGALLERLRAIHDTTKPLVRADYAHALDTWQWTLRLDPAAGIEVQMAALLHDIERLESEADARIEHRMPDYQGFKDAHARRGGEIAGELARACGAAAPTCARVASLVASHERFDADPERRLLCEADALSFFSLNSAGYVDYFGRDQARRKVAYTYGRLSHVARQRLRTMRLRADVQQLLGEVAGTDARGYALPACVGGESPRDGRARESASAEASA